MKHNFVVEEYSLPVERRVVSNMFSSIGFVKMCTALGVLGGGGFCAIQEIDGRKVFKIFIDEEMKDLLTPAEYIALLKHEEGHIVTGQADEDGNAISLNSSEQAADAYAVSEGCEPAVVRSAISKAVHRSMHSIVEKKSWLQWLFATLGIITTKLHPEYLRRMSALRKLERAC